MTDSTPPDPPPVHRVIDEARAWTTTVGTTPRATARQPARRFGPVSRGQEARHQKRHKPTRSCPFCACAPETDFRLDSGMPTPQAVPPQAQEGV